MPSHYIYRFLRTTWGIYVDLTAEWIAQTDFEGPTLEVIPKVHLSIEVTLNLQIDEQEFLVLAIKLTRHELEERLKEQSPIVIRIVDLGIVFTDYEPEGLTYALVGWMGQELGIDSALPPPTFDKENKRYVFPDVFSADK
jgi:hypothetical protein